MILLLDLLLLLLVKFKLLLRKLGAFINSCPTPKWIHSCRESWSSSWDLSKINRLLVSCLVDCVPISSLRVWRDYIMLVSSK